MKVRAKVLRPIPGTSGYEIGKVYDFEGNIDWLKQRYIEPVKEDPEKATAKPEKR